MKDASAVPMLRAPSGTSLEASVYFVRTATLVDPRVTPFSVNRTKTRCVAGSNGTSPPALTKTLNVEVWRGAMRRVTVAAGDPISAAVGALEHATVGARIDYL
jgi:hypothetical protein